MSEKAVKNLPEEAQAYLREYGYRCKDTGKLMLTVDDDRFTNQSTTPNLLCVPGSVSSTSRIIAARDIADGEELTCNYASFDADYHEYAHLLREAPQPALQAPATGQRLFQRYLISKFNIGTHREAVR